MRKGRPLLVEGRLKLDTWEDKNTHQKQSKLKVVLEAFSFIDSKGPEGGAPAGEAPRRPAAGPQRRRQADGTAGGRRSARRGRRRCSILTDPNPLNRKIVCQKLKSS